MWLPHARNPVLHCMLYFRFPGSILGTGWPEPLDPFCAGVIWRGDSLIDGVPETLDMLRAMVRPVVGGPTLLPAEAARPAAPRPCLQTAGVRASQERTASWGNTQDWFHVTRSSPGSPAQAAESHTAPLSHAPRARRARSWCS